MPVVVWAHARRPLLFHNKFADLGKLVFAPGAELQKFQTHVLRIFRGEEYLPPIPGR
jgi:hypothetical protein